MDEKWIDGVAPYTGAWIETWLALSMAVILMSHPTRVRGLKLEIWVKEIIPVTSHPTRVRGLKLTTLRSIEIG